MEYAILALLGLVAILQVVLLLKKPEQEQNQTMDLGAIERIVQQYEKNSSDLVFSWLKMMLENVSQKFDSNDARLRELNDKLYEGIRNLSQDNAQQLEKMREVVEEKLDKTLETRLTKSFENISARLKDVFEGLGEMQNLAKGVGDLKNVLSNVKVRGTFGEVQLENLLAQVLHTSQYEKSYKLNKNSNEMVDFCVRIPMNNSDDIMLPIDCKFPIEQYQRIVVASEKGDSILIEKYAKELEAHIKKEAKNIANKYIVENVTTDFAIMYLPLEGLYAEVLKREGLLEYLQANHIYIAGPTTFGAMLSSFQMGFRTIAIQKRSIEIVDIMHEFRKDFKNFMELLALAQRKISEVQTNLENATKRSQIITRKLSAFDDIADKE